MLDIKFIKENIDLVQKVANLKGININIKDIISLDQQRREIIFVLDELRRKRNELSKQISVSVREGNEQKITETKLAVKEINKLIDERLQVSNKIEGKYNDLMLKVPNVISPDTPIGKNDKENVEVRKVGGIPDFNFDFKDHISLGTELDIIDIPRGVKVAGTRNYFLKNFGVNLQRAIQQLAIDFLNDKGFTIMDVPLMLKKEMFTNTGFFPLGEDQTYEVNDKGKWLIGTSEVPLISYYSDEEVSVEEPIFLAGISNCFRSEVGSAGRDVHGLYRVHQFSKVEQVVICKNDIKISENILEDITNNSEEILQLLELPYRVVSVCTGDMGQGVYKKYDIETWMPSRNDYGETQSASLLLDFQARRSNIRYRNDDDNLEYCHTLNNTAIASPRILIPFLENHQQEDGSIYIPKALRKYLGDKEYII